MLFIIFGCKNNESNNKSTKLAKVNNAILYEDDLLNQIPKGLGKEDSTMFVEQFIYNWTKEQVVLQKAEEVLPEENKNVRKRLESYRKSLIIHTYEQAYIESRLNTEVTQNEIESYYNNNSEDFTLKGYIIKGYFASFPDSIDRKELNSWYKLKEKEDYTSLKSFSHINAIEYHIDTSNWFYFDKVLEKIPLENNIHISSFIKKKRNIKFEENGIAYYVNVIDYKLKDEPSPLAFEKEKIKTIIINQKTQKLRQELNDNLYKDALNKHQITIYDN